MRKKAMKYVAQVTELSTEKVELSKFDDLKDKYDRIASQAPKLKNKISQDATSLIKIGNDLQSVVKESNQVSQLAKELGADKIQQQADALGKVANSLSKAFVSSGSQIQKLSDKI